MVEDVVVKSSRSLTPDEFLVCYLVRHSGMNEFCELYLTLFFVILGFVYDLYFSASVVRLSLSLSD